MNSEVTQIVCDLKSDALYRLNIQPILRQYVIDKSFPLDERFPIWATYCDKEHRGSVVHSGEYGIIGDLVYACEPYDYVRYHVYTWEDFLEYAKDDEVGMPVEQFKEMLIETNFGSFEMDW